MINSMTGFGSAERTHGQWLLRVEVRSVNHRDFQVTLRLPETFNLSGAELQKLIEGKVHRGHVYLSLHCRPRPGESAVLVDRQRVAHYLSLLREVAAAHEVPFEVDLGAILRLPGALKDMTADEELRDTLWPEVKATVQEAVDALAGMRCTEGENIARQLGELCCSIQTLSNAVEQEQGSFVVGYRNRLRERVKRLLQGADVPVDDHTLAREVAIYADRCDVSEEIARLRSHVQQFTECFEGPAAPVGRKMEFLGQEMLREAGTMAAKVPAGPQVRQVIELKSAIEQLREQVRNVE